MLGTLTPSDLSSRLLSSAIYRGLCARNSTESSKTGRWKSESAFISPKTALWKSNLLKTSELAMLTIPATSIFTNSSIYVASCSVEIGVIKTSLKL